MAAGTAAGDSKSGQTGHKILDGTAGAVTSSKP